MIEFIANTVYIIFIGVLVYLAALNIMEIKDKRKSKKKKEVWTEELTEKIVKEVGEKTGKIAQEHVETKVTPELVARAYYEIKQREERDKQVSRGRNQ